MGYPLNKARKNFTSVNNSKKKLFPGTYNSEIISVDDAPGCVPGSAFIITRRLILLNGEEEFEKTEKLIWSLENDRTSTFINKLEDNGIFIDDSDDLIGVKEIVEIAYETVHGHQYLNIVDSKIIVHCDVVGSKA